MSKVVKLWKKTTLISRIVIGIIIGIILGLTVPGASVIGLFGTLFVGALKSVAPILVFVLVLSSIANTTGGFGHKFKTVIILYLTSTLLAALVAVIASFLFPVNLTLNLDAYQTDAIPSSIADVLINMFNNIVSNPITALANANYLCILAWAILLGIAMHRASASVKNALVSVSDAVSQIVKWIISCAPIGILGLVYTTVSENGLGIFKDYGKLLLVLVSAMLIVALVIDPIIASIALKRNAYPLALRCLRESGITAFFTRSSAANIPVNMNLCKRLGLDKDMYSVSLPLGATINMDGAAVTITVMALATAHTMGISVDMPTALLLSFLATLGACGASGIAGGSLLLIPMACSLFGVGQDISMQVVAIGMIIGVVQDSLETAINSSGDVLFAATAEYRSWIKEGREFKVGAIINDDKDE
ncbi:MAG: serine/threonine transporter SstT [Lachnospiraceae bacterium]|nr:serine/threonine transporter SstT [Lachnospiraceae bacterium]